MDEPKKGKYTHEEEAWKRKDTTLVRIRKETMDRVKTIADRAGRKTWRTADRMINRGLDQVLGCRFHDSGRCELLARDVQCAGSRNACEHEDFTSGKLYI